MNYLNNAFHPKKLYVLFFFLFSFFSVIFYGFTKVNNLFHLSALLFIITLYLDKDLRMALYRNRDTRQGMAFIAAMLLYFSASNLWSDDPGNIESTLTHSVYLLLYLAMLTTILNGSKRNQLFIAIIAGLTVLSLYTLLFERSNILLLRQTLPNNPGPKNVIDLAGCTAIGVILTLIVFRDTKNKFILLALPILLATIAITQSRGPVLSLLVALIVTTNYRSISRKNVAYLAICLALAAIILIYSTAGEMLIGRFEMMSTQGMTRVSIWHHTLELTTQAPFVGYGFDKELSFTNYNGEYIRTTHSLYLGALLQGGIIGLMFLSAVLIYGLLSAFRRMKSGMRLEAALYIFMLIFYVSQGMFVVGNPSESWFLFWFPLGVIMAQRRLS
jgi:O-antigen ligase